MSSAYDSCIRSSLECARQFHRNVCRTADEFKQLRENLLQNLPITRFQQVSNEIIDEHAKMNRPALVVFGANSSGKTSFIQRFVGIGDILPSDFGPVTARIVQLTYAPPNRACFQVYSSMEKTEVIQPKTDLSMFFQDPTEPDWAGIAAAILPYVQRPDEIDEEWAKRFIELCLPSDVLSLGIDVYDTPGFLSDNREKILIDNLHELVIRSKPTLLFLYENSTISDTDKSCFLAMKKALGQMERVSTFFLNTKADCISIANDYSLDDDPENVPLEEFEQVLQQKRQRCYDLLLKREEMANEALGQAPKSFSNCTFFDICTTPRDYDPWETYTNHINSSTFQRIVRFTVESYSDSSLLLAEDILRTVDDYFDLVVSTTSRSSQQWTQLREEAIDWGQKFFEEYAKLIPNLTDELHENILSTFDRVKTEIIRQAALTVRTDDRIDTLLRDNEKTVREYVRIAVQEQIIKVAANQTIINKCDQVKNLIANHFPPKRFQAQNELLSLSQRQVLTDISPRTLQQSKDLNQFISVITSVQMRFSRFWRSLPTRLSGYRKEFYNHFIQTKVEENKAEDVYDLLVAMDEYATLSNEAGRRKLAEYCLNEIENDIRQKKELFSENLTEWIQKQKQSFNKTIDDNYQEITTNLKNQQALNSIISPFIKSFAKIECQLLAAIELNRRKGIAPIIGREIGRGGYYSVHEIQWDSDTNLAGKRLIVLTDDHIKLAALEAHYHRIATLLELDSIAPLLSIYDDQQEFWLIMPKYPQSLRQYLQQTPQTGSSFPRIVSLAISIAETLKYLHSIGIVHRDLKASNIMLDENEKCHLIDFGTAKLGVSNTTVVGTFPLPPEIIGVHFKNQTGILQYDGTAADVYAFGILLYEMLPKPGFDRLTKETISRLDELLNSHSLLEFNTNFYKNLIRSCLKPNPADRPTFSQLVANLQDILRQTEVKECMMCLTADRDIRFEPCRHKVSCQQCWERWSTTVPNGNNRCIFCKTIVTHFIQDNSNATFIV